MAELIMIVIYSVILGILIGGMIATFPTKEK